MRYNVYKKLVVPLLFIICMEILLCSASIIPIVSSMNNNSTNETTFEDKTISNQVIVRYVYRFRLFGPIYHLSIDGNNYEFESNNLRGLRIERFWGRGLGCSFEIEYFRGRETRVSLWGFNFRGIIKPNFICGCFYLIH